MSNCNTIRRFDHVKQKIQMTKELVFNSNKMFDTVKPTGCFPTKTPLYATHKPSQQPPQK